MVRLLPVNGLSATSVELLHLCGSARFPLGTFYLQDATRSNKMKQKTEVKKEETKNKNTKSGKSTGRLRTHARMARIQLHTQFIKQEGVDWRS